MSNVDLNYGKCPYCGMEYLTYSEAWRFYRNEFCACGKPLSLKNFTEDFRNALSASMCVSERQHK